MSKIEKFVDKVGNGLKRLHRNRSTTVKPWTEEENKRDIYAILPPLEMFMGVSESSLEHFLWNRFESGNIVIGRVSGKGEFGLYVILICYDAGKAHDIEGFEFEAQCPKSEIPTVTNHENPLLRFAVGDLIRAAIIDVDKSHQSIIISLQSRNTKASLTLGLIGDEDLPVSYKRSCSKGNDTYDKIISQSAGFFNPNVVEYLNGRLVLGVYSSLIEDMQNPSIPAEEYFDQLRKKQSSKVANSAVKRGIELYGNGKIMEALHELNHALDLDIGNVEALVARGAVYANKRTFLRAIADFEHALKLEPSHKNAKKYLVEVLVERAKTIELEAQDVQQIKEATKLYKQALELDRTCEEAIKAIGVLEKSAALRNAKRQSSSTDTISDEDKTSKTATIVKVRHLLEQEVEQKHRSKSGQRRSRNKSTSSRHRSSSSSSTSSSSSSTSSSSSSSDSSYERKRKKRKLSSSSKEQSRKKDTKHHDKKIQQNSASKVSSSKSFDKPLPRSQNPNNVSRTKRPSFSRENSHRRNSLDSNSRDNRKPERRDSTDSKPRRQSNNEKNSKNLITDVNKKTFSSILKQISKFEGKRKSL